MFSALLACAALACESSPRGDHARSETGGSTTGATGGTGDGATTTGGRASGGSGSDAGTGGNSGGSGRGSVPGETPEETDILRPLTTSDGTIDAADGEELVSVMQAIGVARGYAMCRCFGSPPAPPEDIDELVTCAHEQTGFATITRPDGARCIADRVNELPEFASYLRCEARRFRDNGLSWTEVCVAPGTVPAFPPACKPPEGKDELILECDETVYCADEEVIRGKRCDAVTECEDGSDERSCYDHVGQDQVTCDGEIWKPVDFCYSACGVMTTPPLCNPDVPDSFLCEDGGEVGSEVVCDRVEDCADGADEAHCLR